MEANHQSDIEFKVIVDDQQHEKGHKIIKRTRQK